MCRTSYYGEFLIFNRSCSDIRKKYLFQQKIYTIKIIFLTLGVGGIFLPGSLPSEALSSPVQHILASSGCWGSCQLLAPSTSSFPTQSTYPSFPRGVSGSICSVTWASAAVLESWAGAFPSEALSEVTCWGSLSHPTTSSVAPAAASLWVTSEKPLWSLKSLGSAERLSSLSPCTSFSHSTDLPGIPAYWSSPKKSAVPFLLSCPKQRKEKGNNVTSLYRSQPAVSAK